MATTTTPQEERQRHVPDAFERVRYLRRHAKLTEADIADGTGASTRTVRRWIAAEPEAGEPHYTRQIDDLHAIVQELEESLTPKGIRQWLRARNRYLDGERPIDLLREGEFRRVREAALAFRDGYYV
jgi:transcriptional regulator with XRE-family HTH domain